MLRRLSKIAMFAFSGHEGQFSVRVYSCKPIKLKFIDCIPAIVKPAITKAPLSFDTKFAQYEALFLQLADEVSD